MQIISLVIIIFNGLQSFIQDENQAEIVYFDFQHSPLSIGITIYCLTIMGLLFNIKASTLKPSLF